MEQAERGEKSTAHLSALYSPRAGKRNPPDTLITVRVQFVDRRFELGAPERGRELYLAGHIPGASFLDVDDELSDLSVPGAGRHPLPSAERFAASASRAGLAPGVLVATSAIRFAKTTITAVTSRIPISTGIVERIDGAWMNCVAHARPTRRSSRSRWRPRTGTGFRDRCWRDPGSRALRRACLKITTRSGTPFARAVFTKSWFSESSIEARMNRESNAMFTRTRVNTGSTRWMPRSVERSQRLRRRRMPSTRRVPKVGTVRVVHIPPPGNHLSGGAAKMLMSMMPSQNVGSE